MQKIRIDKSFNYVMYLWYIYISLISLCVMSLLSRYFHGGALEEGVGSGSVYGIVAYQSADCHPGLPVATYGPFTCPQNVVETVDKLQ